MKVLFISSWYPNSTNPLKGIFVKKHAEAIKKAGVEIEVLALTISYSNKLFEKKFSRTVDEAGITTHLIELNSRFYKFIHLDLILQFAYTKKYFYRKIKPNFSPDIIHSNVLFPAAILGYWLAKKENLPHIITEHWSKVDNFFKKSLYAKSGKKTYNESKNVTVVSEFLRKSISKHFQSPEKIKVVPNVVDTSVFSYKAKQENSKLTFCCVAHWSGVKRPDLIYNALNSFSKNFGKPIVLNVIGEGPLLNDLRNKKWNFEVNYLGNLDRSALAKQLQASDYFLHASDTETFSIVIAEALATGTPVVASNAGAIPELVNGGNGFICENEVEKWTNAIQEVSKQKFNHKKISEESQNFGLEKIGNKFKEIYELI